MPGLLLGLLKLNAVLLFLWYLWEFASESWDIGNLSLFVLLSGVLFVGLAGWIFTKSFLEELKTEPRTFPRKNGWLFFVLAVAPILAVALVRLLYAAHHPFNSKLLDGTETQIERFYATFR